MDLLNICAIEIGKTTHLELVDLSWALADTALLVAGPV